MEDTNIKICRMCAEPIKAMARLCPHCRTDQRQSALTLVVAPWLVFPILLLVGLGGLSLAYRMFDPGKDFAPFKDRFEVVSSSMLFSTNQNELYITTVGTVRNNSDYAWKEVQMEVRYFDRESKLIDVGAQVYSELVVQPRSESAFRVRTRADQPEQAYASHKVFVRSGKDIRRWP